MLVADLSQITRTIGCEYEFAVPVIGTGTGADVQRVIADVLSANGVRALARGYSHEPVPAGYDLAVEHDGSVQGESRYQGITWVPVEVKTRILQGPTDWDRVVPRALEIVKYLGARVNASCGYHLHLGLPEVHRNPHVLRSIYNLFHRCEPIIFSLLPPSRRNSAYCRPLPDQTKLLHGCRSVADYRRVLAQFPRYQAVNWTHAFERGEGARLELRYAQSTLAVGKAGRWLHFCLQMLQHAAVNRNCQAGAQLPSSKAGLERMLVSAGFRSNSKVYAKVCPDLKATARWLRGRWREFNEPPSPLNELKAVELRRHELAESEA